MDAVLPSFPSTLPSISGSYPAGRRQLGYARYVRRLLATNYEVEAVADGEAALQAARERPPDLVLSDDDAETRWVRLVEGCAKTSAGDDSGHSTFGARAGRRRASRWKAGADDYLIKPFSARTAGARQGASGDDPPPARGGNGLRHSEKLSASWRTTPRSSSG